LIELILREARELLSSDYAGLFNLVDRQFHLISGEGESISNAFRGLFVKIIENNEPLILNNGDLAESEVADSLTKLGLSSFICVPNTIGNDFNILMVGRSAKEKQFGAADADWLALLSRQAAIAMENARLYSELQEHVSQIQKSQQALIRAEKMAAVGRLTTSIAHEINNPLQSVRNCLHLIEHGDLSEGSLNHYITLVTEEIDRLMKISKRMLDFYRPGALDRQVEDVNSLVDRVLKLLEAQLKRNKIQVNQDFADDLPHVIVVGNQIQQAILNIVLNAMEAMPDGGEILIQTGMVDHHVIIRIEDTGSGVPVIVRENIFEPFVSTKEERLGLGLTVSYGIVTAHGGNLELLLKSGRGAQFQIILPAGR
jgi:signal transduction histidine kinase